MSMTDELYDIEDDPLAQSTRPPADPRLLTASLVFRAALAGEHGLQRQVLCLEAILTLLLSTMPRQRIDVNVLELDKEIGGQATLIRVLPNGRILLGLGDPRRAEGRTP